MALATATVQLLSFHGAISTEAAEVLNAKRVPTSLRGESGPTVGQLCAAQSSGPEPGMLERR